MIWGSPYEWKIWTRCMDSLAGVCLLVGKFCCRIRAIYILFRSLGDPQCWYECFEELTTLMLQPGIESWLLDCRQSLSWLFLFPGDVRSAFRMLFCQPGRQLGISWCQLKCMLRWVWQYESVKWNNEISVTVFFIMCLAEANRKRCTQSLYNN